MLYSVRLPFHFRHLRLRHLLYHHHRIAWTSSSLTYRVQRPPRSPARRPRQCPRDALCHPSRLLRHDRTCCRTGNHGGLLCRAAASFHDGSSDYSLHLISSSYEMPRPISYCDTPRCHSFTVSPGSPGSSLACCHDRRTSGSFG
jgi:hypothetical protein